MSGVLNAFAGGSYGVIPTNTVAPVVSGTAQFGQILSSTTGTWTAVPAATYAYQWQRGGSNIGSATSSTYTLVQADVGSTIRCVVTATNALGSTPANSNSTASVTAIVPTAPTIGTATATAYNSATVSYTASSSNGGANITSYTAVSSPGGITGSLSTSGSGTITVSGLSRVTSYTFTVYATNSVGNSSSSSASNSITTPAQVPGAPTIGTATLTGNTTATVSYTAPADNGGATITSYTATSSPGGITGTLSTSGSGTISISGLSQGTSYTFTVKATNSVGQSAASSASNSITTPVVGCAVYTSPGSYTWYAPSGVTSVSAVVVGGGGSSRGAYSGRGGYLGYKNNISVTPSSGYTLVVGAAGCKNGPCGICCWYGKQSYFVNTSTLQAGGGGAFFNCSSPTAGYVGTGGGAGGNANPGGSYTSGTGGGGAGGYAGSGGTGARGSYCCDPCPAASGCGGSGGGGGGGGQGKRVSGVQYNGGRGGGVGIYGQGSSGGGGAGGSPGSNGGDGSSGSYGAGGGFSACPYYPDSSSSTSGAARIIWPGNTRSYPGGA